MPEGALHLPAARRGPGPLAAIAVVALAVIGLLLFWAVHRSAAPAAKASLENEARHFVALGRALGRITPQEVDSYFGPADLGPAADAPAPTLAALKTEIAQLGTALDGAAGPADPRRSRLAERTRRLGVLAEVMDLAKPLPFDEEARRLYGLAPTAPDEARYAAARAALDRLLPGAGSLTTRVEAYRRRFIIPEKRRPELFARALAECRWRTLQHWPLPPSERLDVEWTSAVDAAWHRYQGHFRSTLQINPQAVAFLGSAVDVACHEGYPGHHVQFVLSEAAQGRLNVEDEIVMLRSPASMLREGAAEYGVSLIFPVAERLAFERDVLFPMAGFAAGEAARFEQVRQLLYDLAPASLPILQAYRDGSMSAEAAAAALDRDALIASPQALLGFTDALGAYVIGYTAARENIRDAVEAHAPPGEARWAALRKLIQSADDAPLSHKK